MSALVYSGQPMNVAKAVSDCAAGGMVLASPTTMRLLEPDLGTLLAPTSPVLPVHLGDYAIDSLPDDTFALCALQTLALEPRLAHCVPLRNVTCKRVRRATLPPSSGRAHCTLAKPLPSCVRAAAD